MAQSSIMLADLKARPRSSILRFGEARNVKRRNLHTSHRQRPPSHTYRHLFKVGSMYSLGGFDVTGCNQNYRLFDSPRLFRFSDSTEFEELMGVDMLLLDSQRDGGRWSKRRRATEKVAERDGTSGLELMEQVTESVTGDRKGNCCSSMAQWRLIGSQTGGIKVAVEESNMTTYLLMRLLLNIDGLKTAGKARV
ncbi:hypothetical protein HID58_059999 [Brassica napus]|uniref:Uncharacterized protein n=2 Tax=Brassica napus TaxID=3708 RepID=A0ABQ7ZUR6_BRANA|nr:hypothetical protein HID58_059999 [Brassica napus]